MEVLAVIAIGGFLLVALALAWRLEELEREDKKNEKRKRKDQKSSTD